MGPPTRENSKPFDYDAGALPAGISVVCPAFNSEASVGELVRRVGEVLGGSEQPYEVILVDDGSRDRTWLAIEEVCRVNPIVRGVSLSRNYGQHNALLCGIRLARYSVTVTIDDDLQNPPEEIPKLLEALDAGRDVVYGTPDLERHGFWRDIASRITKISLQGAMGATVAREVSAFRAFKTRLRGAFAEYSGPFVSIDVLLTWGTTRFGAVIVRHDERAIGESNYSFGMLTIHALNMVTGFSTRPLQFASLVGFAFTGFGFVALAYVLGRYFLQGTPVAGFPFLASMIAIFSGAQLFSLGIMGEYLARMHMRSLERPAYAIREEIDGVDVTSRVS